MALKSDNGRQTHHTQTGLPVCCEQALKSVGEQNTHGGYRCGGLRETARAQEVTRRGGVTRLCRVYMEAIWLRGSVLRRQITDREYRLALRAAATKSASRSLRTYTSI
jgi:hypothetical protein